MKNLFKGHQYFNRILLVFNLVLLSFLLFIYAKDPYRLVQTNRLEIIDANGRVVYKIDERGIDDQLGNVDNRQNYNAPRYIFKRFGSSMFTITNVQGQDIKTLFLSTFDNKIKIDNNHDFYYNAENGAIMYNNAVYIGRADNIEQAESISIDYFVNNLFVP